MAKISARRWEQYENHCDRVNPILVGLHFLKVFEEESVTTYAKAAEVLGVSRQRVFQLTALVTKLPREITDYLVANGDDPAILRHFTERRLRPLTMMEGKNVKIRRFQEMLADVGLLTRQSRGRSRAVRACPESIRLSDDY